MARDPNWKIRALGDRRAEILLYDEIGGWFGTTAEDFARQIDELDVDDLTLRVNSPGGDVFDGIAIMNSLKRHRAKVTAIVEGLAASSASIIIAGAADTVIMGEGAQQMVHDAWSFGMGDAAELMKTVDLLNKTSDDMAGIYARRSGGTSEEWRELMKAETWFNAEEAVTAGLADRVDDDAAEGVDDPVAAFARGRVMAKFKHRSRESAPAPKLAAQARRKDTMSLKNIAQRLGLSEDADEAAILAALDEKNDTSSTSTEEEVPAAEKRLEEAREEDDDEKAAEAEAELSNVRTAAEEEAGDEDDDTVLVDKDVYEDLLRRAAQGDEAKGEAAEREVEDLVNAAIRDGKVLAAKKDKLIAEGLTDLPGLKAKLDSLASGIIPVSEKGRGGSDETRSASASKNGKTSHKQKNEMAAKALGLDL